MFDVSATKLSCLLLYEIRSLIVPIRRPCCFAKPIKSSNRDIVPSSFIISQITPDSFKPANLEISTAASVCPALTKTPPSFALRGKTCPGVAISEDERFLPIATEMV